MMKPQLIVNIQDLDKLWEKLSIQTCGNDVYEFTTKMSELRENIVIIVEIRNPYDDIKFLAILFQDLA